MALLAMEEKGEKDRSRRLLANHLIQFQCPPWTRRKTNLTEYPN
jgi:hypothetical protein